VNPAFEQIGIIGKRDDTSVTPTLLALVRHLQNRGVQVLLDAVTLQVLHPPGAKHLPREELVNQAKLIIVVGGDGSLLSAARSLGTAKTPLLGVNRGRLGFLVDVSPNRMRKILDEVLSGQYHQEKRHLLHAQVTRDGEIISEDTALNDIVIHSRTLPRMLEFETTVDGRPLNNHRADGFIVATPTGSTAYALSGGGPILHPTIPAMVLVPICPHTFSDRPLVIDANCTVNIRIRPDSMPPMVSWDGQTNIDLNPGDEIQVAYRDHSITLIHPQDYDYFEILRDKLHWGHGGREVLR